jgi:HPt (histidine-containing phosphotransfer) domain-containing protein
MQNADLEREILGLFLTQLPRTIALIEAAQSNADWKLYTHTLKGSAAAIGARRLQSIAIDLEVLGFEGDLQIRALRLRVLQAAAAEFRETVSHIHL